MIDIRDLCFTYKDNTQVFKAFDVLINRGESWTIIGPSGCGKTTLLYLIAGLQKPQSGSIKIAGKPLIRPRPRTGLVLQDHGLLPWATVYENTFLGYKIRHLYGPDGKHSPEDALADSSREKNLTDHWLNWLGIMQLADKYPGQLSRGQRQRAAIARTLVLEPDLLLMDEPFSALDAPIRKELQKVMNRFHEESGLTSVTVTHDIEEAVIMGNKIMVLKPDINTAPMIIDNPHATGSHIKKQAGFTEMCGKLHDIIGDLS